MYTDIQKLQHQNETFLNYFMKFDQSPSYSQSGYFHLVFMWEYPTQLHLDCYDRGPIKCVSAQCDLDCELD